jgi:uncharacterized protein YfaS (alpha-2-macroglobulin family)
MRTKFRSTWIFFICIGGIFCLSECKKKEDPKAIRSPESVVEVGELQVTYSSPLGQTSEPHESDSIVVIFDHPMFPLSSFEEQPKPDIMKISPEIPGTFHWLNPKTLAFSPKDRFPYSTDVKITIESGTRTFDGFVLKEDHQWSFTTVRPLLKQHFPQNKQKWIRLEEKILLIFNQSVQVADNKEFIQIVGLNKESTESFLDFTLKHPTAKQLKDEEIRAQASEVLILEPTESMKPDMTYYIEIHSGLGGKEGLLGMEKSRIFEFSTFNSFQFESFEPQQGYDIYQPLKFQFSNPVDYKEFIQKIRFEPEVSIPDYYSEWDQANSTLWLSLAFLPEKMYKLWIGADLEDDFGNKLEKEINLAFTTPPYPRSITMDTGLGVLEAYSDLKYPISAVNADDVFIHGGSVAKQDVIPLLKTQKIFWTSEKISKRGLFTVEKFMKLNPPRNTRGVFPIEIKEFMKNKFGFVFIQADTLSEDTWERYPKAFLQITELGISGKFSRENNTIWVTELKTGHPAPNSQIEIRDDDNRIRWRGKTDKDGKVETPGWGPLKIPSQDRWSKPRQWIFASRGKDTTFLSSEWGTGVYPYYFDIQYDWNPQPIQYQGQVFTERGIYRAGETVHLKGIFREQKMGEWAILQVKEVTCEILDPFQKSVFKKNRPVDSFGSIHFDFTTDQDYSLGEYQIQTSIPSQVKGNDPFRMFSSFRVEAFRPAEFEVHLRTAEESFTFGETYTGELRASYLFGGGMAGQDVSWHLRLNPTQYTPPGHKGFVFGDQISRWEIFREDEGRLLSSGESSLDEEGKIIISAKLESEKERDSVLAALEATVRGPNRRAITNRIQTIVHRGNFYIGLRPSSTFLSDRDSIDVNLISVDPEGTLLSDKKIQLILIKREWHSVRKSEFGGRFGWITEKTDIEVETRTIQTKKVAETITFLPEKSGFYILKATGRDRKGNDITTTTYFYVTGKDYVPWERMDEDVVELVANDTNYQPGEVAKILVKSPYESAKALITIEREFILHSQVVDLLGSSETIEIPITSEHIPNVFVSVLLVQGRVSAQDSDNNGDIGKPSFKIGYTELAVDPSEKRLDIDIQTNKPNFKPGEEVTLTVETKNWAGDGTKASILVAVVDVGVLNLIGYQTPDPFSLFYSPKLLSVQTSELRQHIVEQQTYGEKGDDVGGGAGEEKMASFAHALNEVELRGNFKLTAYWNPSVLTNDEGNATVTFKLPDNLTTFRIMAVAQTKNSQFGRSEKTFKVSKQLLLQPSLPRFARVGDSFEGGVVVHNYSSEKGQVTLNCEAEGIRLVQNSERKFVLDPGKGREILFKFRVESPGQANIAFRAQMGLESDGLETELPLMIPRPTETVALFNSTTESVEELIKIPEEIYPFESLIQFLASSSALSGLKGSVDFLTNYPYLCLEQRLSRILPYIFAEDLIIDFRLSEMNRREIREYVQKGIKDIYSFQRPNGGFGLWPESLKDSAFNSCFAAFALIQARQADYVVDRQRLDQVANYLRNLVKERLDRSSYPYSEVSWATIKSFALYCLALLNSPEPALAENLYTEKDKLSLLGKAFLLKALNKGTGSLAAQNSLLQDLLNKIKISPTEAHFEEEKGRVDPWIYSSNLRTTAVILQSMISVGSDNPFVSQIANWLVQRRQAGNWATTQENFYVFYALNEYYKKYEDVHPDFKLDVSLADKELLKVAFKDPIQDIEKAEISLSQFYPGSTIPLGIFLDGQGTLFYETRLTYAPQKQLSARDEGFTIYKEITSMDGSPLSSIKAGSLVVVSLQIIVPRETLFIVVNDPLPAGLEAVNPTFLTESEEQQRRMSQLESERQGPRWWRGFNHIEMHDDRILLFADSLLPGIHTHRYLARALTPGFFQAPGTKIEEMYSPEVFGRSSELTIEVKK